MPHARQLPPQDGPGPADADLAALLAGTAQAAPGLRPVAEVLAALTAEATAGELAGEASTLAEFRRRSARSAGSARWLQLLPRTLPARLSTKVAVAAAAMAVVLGGAATAAFANVLPAPIQRFAHDTIGAPDAPQQHRQPARGGPASGRSAAAAHRAGHGKGGRPGPRDRGTPATRGHPHARSKHGNPHAPGQHGNPHDPGKHGNPHATQAVAAHLAGPPT